MLNKISALQNLLIEKNLDSLFVSDQHNVSYLTGFTGLSPNEREGFLLVTQNSASLLTFPTYFGLYSKKNTKQFQTLCITSRVRLSAHIGNILQKEKLKKLAIEKHNLTLSEFDSLKKNLAHIRLIKMENVVEKLRIIKSADEIERIKKAAKITDEVFHSICKSIRIGKTEKDIAIEIESCIKHLADDVAFSPIVAVDTGSAIPHYMPHPDVRVNRGSLILLDFGTKYQGYCSDMTRVVFCGTPAPYQEKMYTTVLHAQQNALNTLKVGIRGNTVDVIARKTITDAGYEAYQHGLGHGVGTAIHEAPKIKMGSADMLEEHMVLTVEPGIYIEGRCGVRIEDLVVLRKYGPEILSQSTKETIIL